MQPSQYESSSRPLCHGCSDNCMHSAKKLIRNVITLKILSRVIPGCSQSFPVILSHSWSFPVISGNFWSFLKIPSHSQLFLVIYAHLHNL